MEHPRTDSERGGIGGIEVTIVGWIVFTLFAVMFLAAGLCSLIFFDDVVGKVAGMSAVVVASFILLIGMLWYYGNTASGRRAVVDQKSELNNGIERTVTDYTADGKVMAQYTGEIDIEGNDGGYVLFDFDGKRYTYYNCFVESIAEIE